MTLLLVLMQTSLVLGADAFDATSTTFQATVRNGAVTRLQGDDGTLYVQPPREMRARAFIAWTVTIGELFPHHLPAANIRVHWR